MLVAAAHLGDDGHFSSPPFNCMEASNIGTDDLPIYEIKLGSVGPLSKLYLTATLHDKRSPLSASLRLDSSGYTYAKVEVDENQTTALSIEVQQTP